MSASAQPTPFSLTVGGCRLGDIPPQLRRALVFPGANPLIKQEEMTLVWKLPLALPGSVQTGVVKLYRRRGVWSRFWGGVLPSRVQREFGALCILADGGVPCSQPLLWGWGTAPGQGHFELLLTREIPGAVSLREYLATGDRLLRDDDFLVLFAELRRMHERGVYHGALSPKNILVVALPNEGWDFHLIDLARAVLFPGDITGSRMARFDLLSLMRRLVQMRGDSGCERFLLQYGLPEGELGAFMARLKRFRPTRHTRNWLALRFGLQAGIARCRRGASRP